MPVKSEKAFVHVRVRNAIAKGLRRIAFINHRKGIQMEVELASVDYIQKHGVLRNPRDNGK